MVTSSQARTPAPLDYFAPCQRGLEAALAAELQRLGAADATAAPGGVAFRGPRGFDYRVNLHSRIASRVLRRVGAFPYASEDELYAAARGVEWPTLFEAERTIRVNVAAIASPLRSLEFATLRIKDAVCDAFRARHGRRPSVDTARPDVRIHAFLEASRFQLYLDTSGEPLFKRGLGREAGEAPLKENLAAGLLELSGWVPGEPLFDPMCGGGTLLMEAAQRVLHVAPGLRRSFGFEQLADFDAALWAQLREEALAACREPGPPLIFGSDILGAQVEAARRNLREAGLDGAVSLKQGNVLELTPPLPGGTVITNPPYGVRLSEQEELAAFYPRLGDALKARYAGWTAWIFTADLRLPKLIGLRPARRIALFNGPLECRLYSFPLVRGSHRNAPSASPPAGS